MNQESLKGKKVKTGIAVLLFLGIGFAGHADQAVLFPETVVVKSGTFQRGDEVGDLWTGCRPAHDVTLTYDFHAGKYEVTFDEYDRFCEATGRTPAYDHLWGRGRRPVIYVNWYDAIAYCNWLSEQAGLKPAYKRSGELLSRDGSITTDITEVQGYRLLTEAEWEYAASGGHEALPIPPRFLYAGGDEIDEVAWYSGNTGDEWIFKGTYLHNTSSKHGASLYEGRSTFPVGLKKPNQLGIHDMSGNVWEWCHDFFAPYTAEDITNPLGPLTSHVRVMRGGAWIFGSNDCRVAGRIDRTATDKLFRIGFRVARTVIPQATP